MKRVCGNRDGEERGRRACIHSQGNAIALCATTNVRFVSLVTRLSIENPPLIAQ